MGSVAIKSRADTWTTRVTCVTPPPLNCSRNSTPFWCITLLCSSSVTKVRNVFANIRGYWPVTPLSCPPRHAPSSRPLVTRSSRPRHALPRGRDSLKCMTLLSLSGLLCCSCATGKQADCRATRGPGRAGKHTFSVKSSSFKLELNKYLNRQPPSFCNAKKGLLPSFKMRYLPTSYSQNWQFKLKRKEGNNFRRIFDRSLRKLGRLWEPIERKFI